jgi:hypothetical protein
MDFNDDSYDEYSDSDSDNESESDMSTDSEEQIENRILYNEWLSTTNDKDDIIKHHDPLDDYSDDDEYEDEDDKRNYQKLPKNYFELKILFELIK